MSDRVTLTHDPDGQPRLNGLRIGESRHRNAGMLERMMEQIAAECDAEDAARVADLRATAAELDFAADEDEGFGREAQGWLTRQRYLNSAGFLRKKAEGLRREADSRELGEWRETDPFEEE